MAMQFEQCLKREVATAEKDKDGFIKEFSEADFDAVVGGWKVRCLLAASSHCNKLDAYHCELHVAYIA